MAVTGERAMKRNKYVRRGQDSDMISYAKGTWSGRDLKEKITHLGRAHHLLWLGPLRHLGNVIVVIRSTLGRLVFLPGRGRLREGRRKAAHFAEAR